MKKPLVTPTGPARSGFDWDKFIERVMRIPPFILLVIAIAVLAFEASDASTDRSLVVRPLSVPDGYATRGLAGPVLANALYAKLAAIQESTHSDHPKDDFHTALDNPIKVEIPGTGLSLEDLSQSLHQHLGHQTVVSGEIFADDAKVVNVSARIGDTTTPMRKLKTGNTVDEALDLLATDITHQVAPYRFAEYANQKGCHEEALQMAPTLALSGSPQDRNWAHALWSNLLILDGDLEGARDQANRALHGDGKLEYAYHNLTLIDLAEGRLDEARSDAEKQTELLRRAANLSVEARGLSANDAAGNAASAAGNFLGAADAFNKALDHVKDRDDVAVVDLSLATAMVRDHDFSRLEELDRDADWVAQQDNRPDPPRKGPIASLAHVPSAALLYSMWFWPFTPPELAAAREMQDWPLLLDLARLYRSQQPRAPNSKTPQPYFAIYDATYLQPLEALAQAHLGQTSTARAWAMSPTPAMCELCRLERGRVLAALGDDGAADQVFRALEKGASGSPYAPYERALLMLKRGDRAGALTEATIAHKRAPEWADPLLVSGQLKLANDRKAAITDFNIAARLAPAWLELQTARSSALAATDSASSTQAKNEAQKARVQKTAANRAMLARLARIRTDIAKDSESSVDDPAGAEADAVCENARIVIG